MMLLFLCISLLCLCRCLLDSLSVYIFFKHDILVLCLLVFREYFVKDLTSEETIQESFWVFDGVLNQKFSTKLSDSLLTCVEMLFGLTKYVLHFLPHSQELTNKLAFNRYKLLSVGHWGNTTRFCDSLWGQCFRLGLLYLSVCRSLHGQKVGIFGAICLLHDAIKGSLSIRS